MQQQFLQNTKHIIRCNYIQCESSTLISLTKSCPCSAGCKKSYHNIYNYLNLLHIQPLVSHHHFWIWFIYNVHFRNLEPKNGITSRRLRRRSQTSQIKPVTQRFLYGSRFVIPIVVVTDLRTPNVIIVFFFVSLQIELL